MNLSLEILHISLRKTPHYGDFAYVSRFFQLSELQNQFDRLLFCVLYKTACVDHNPFPLWILGIMPHCISLFIKTADEPPLSMRFLLQPIDITSITPFFI